MTPPEPVEVTYFVPPASSSAPRTVVVPSTVRVEDMLTAPVAIKVATWKLPEPVAFVKVIPVEETVPTCRLPDPVALVKVSPVVEAVLTCIFPDPVALVKVIPVEETTPRKVTAVTLPEESTLNLEEEATCRSMKLPAKAAGFMPMKVPEAALFWIAFEPNWKSEVEVET